MLLPELQVLTSKAVPPATVRSWLAQRYPSSQVHLGDDAPANDQWSIWLRVHESGHRDWPGVIELAFTQDAELVGLGPELELAAHLAAQGVDCLVPPRGFVKHLPKNAGWSLAVLDGAWFLVDFRGDEVGPRGFWPKSGAPKPVTVEPGKQREGAIDFKAL